MADAKLHQAPYPRSERPPLFAALKQTFGLKCNGILLQQRSLFFVLHLARPWRKCSAQRGVKKQD